MGSRGGQLASKSLIDQTTPNRESRNSEFLTFTGEQHNSKLGLVSQRWLHRRRHLRHNRHAVRTTRPLAGIFKRVGVSRPLLTAGSWQWHKAQTRNNNWEVDPWKGRFFVLFPGTAACAGSLPADAQIIYFLIRFCSILQTS